MKDGTGKERRRSARVPVEGDYFCYPSDMKKRYSCTLKNISATGACITTPRALEREDVVFLHVQGRERDLLKSRVVWRMDADYGLLFFLESASDFEAISFIMNNYRAGDKR
jgi:hypothetical protein